MDQFIKKFSYLDEIQKYLTEQKRIARGDVKYKFDEEMEVEKEEQEMEENGKERKRLRTRHSLAMIA
jgi:hypothetical protein